MTDPKDAERLAEIREHVVNNRVPSWQSPDWKRHYGWRQQDIELLLSEISRLTQERNEAIKQSQMYLKHSCELLLRIESGSP